MGDSYDEAYGDDGEPRARSMAQGGGVKATWVVS